MVKRIVGGIEIDVSRNGFGAIMQTKQENLPIKNRKMCLKWVYLPIFKRWRCKNITINRDEQITDVPNAYVKLIYSILDMEKNIRNPVRSGWR